MCEHNIKLSKHIAKELQLTEIHHIVHHTHIPKAIALAQFALETGRTEETHTNLMWYLSV